MTEPSAPAEPAVLPDPADSAAAAEVQEILRATLAALTPREREVFVLRDLEGVASDQAAEVLGITEGTVRSLLFLARRRLRRLLAPRFAELALPPDGGSGAC